jgi:DNA invertase Pin-like site-specific DNA recombinase
MPRKDIASIPRILVPAAQYVRMSDEAQQYSIENQKAAIAEYAARNGFVVVKTYADPGKSGVIAKNRLGLRELLKDVVSGSADYKAILVYDINRWGRFPNNDEAAHYEFLCASSGIPLHYCAEPFKNDGTATSSLFKALKRSQAAEFSRELGEKVFRGKSRIVELGFWVGGPPGPGYRRLMVSSSGKRKQIMKVGEHKSFTTDRVILVPGPRKEVEGIRQMFKMAVAGNGCTQIARELNYRGFTNSGKPWEKRAVLDAVTNPKYTGCNVWSRSSQKFRATTRIRVAPENWVIKQGAFEPLIDQKTFDLAQANLRRVADCRWTDEQMLRRVRRLLKAKGELNERLFLKARNMPSTMTLRKRFGGYQRLYTLVGYKPKGDAVRRIRLENSARLRRELFAKIKDLFPQHVEITHLPKKHRSMLRIDNSFMVSVLLCKQKRRNGGELHWVVQPRAVERSYITLVGRLNRAHEDVVSFHLFSRLPHHYHRSFENDPWLNTGVRLKTLSEFYSSVTKLQAETGRSQIPLG